MGSPGSVQVVALKPVSCGSVVWRRGGAAQATVVVKATFGIIPDGTARLIAPLPLVADDGYATATGCVVEPSDMAPFLPAAGVVAWAHARAAQPVQAMTVRLAVFRGEARMIDKSLHVFGDRGAGQAPQPPRPFQDMPIVYERAFGGAGSDENPAGVSGGEGRGLPNVVHPAGALAPAGFGPISRRWGARRRLLGALDPDAVDRPGADLPEGIDFAYFSAAPEDQQCDYFHGDEWIVLDGVHAELPRLQTRLPSVRAEARWLPFAASQPSEGRPLALYADTLLIDVERRTCSLVWRGCLALDAEEAAGEVVVYAGIEVPGYPITWPEGIPAHFEGPPSAAFALPAPPEGAAVVEDESTVQRAPAAPVAEGATPPAPALKDKLLRTADVTRSAPASLAALPFTKAAASSTGPRFPAPVVTARPREGLGLTAPAGAVSPFTAGLPFKTGEASFAARAVPPPPPSRPLEDDPPEETRTIDAADLEAHRKSWTAPFALAAPGAKAAAPPAAIPGAPWSAPVPAARAAVPPGEMEMETFVETAGAEQDDAGALPTPARPPPPAVPLPPVVAPAPPVFVAPEAVPPVAVAAVEAAEKERAGDEGTAKEAAPAPIAEAAPVAPVEVDPAAALRAVVEARAAEGVSILDLALAGADLGGVDFHGAVIGRADFTGTRLAGCKMAGVKLAGAKLSNADLSDADLAGADLTGADLSRATLARARFVGASLAEASLADAKGARAVFDEAKLGHARAVGASLDGASLRGVDAPGSVWEKATLDDACFAAANLKEANFARASCARASFAGADLGGANLQRMVGDGADLRGAQLEAADMRQARLQDARLDGAKIGHVAAGKADFARSRFVRADLSGTNLRGARLGGAILAHATLEGADLRDADLEGANLFGAARETAKLTAGARGFVEVEIEAADEG